ncbi:MAG: GDP-mannose 4,6-dehydratase [Armatimonadota bacterium]
MSILVTGGAGFIGSHLAEALLARGESVTCLDNFDPFYDPAAKRRNLEQASESERFRLVEGDIRDIGLLRELLGDGSIRCVVHLAAKAGVQPSLRDALAYQEVNVTGTVTVLEAMRESDVQQLIFGASSSVYGGNPDVPFSEDAELVCQISPYAASKRACELYCRTYHHLHGIPTTCLRFFTVHGPRQRPDLAIHLFTHKILAGETITMYGNQSRDCTYVSDIIDGVLAAIDRPLDFEIINLGDSRPVTVRQMIAAIEEATGVEAKIEHAPERPGDPPTTYADISKAGQLLDYDPKVSLEDGVRRFVEWHREAEPT